MLSMNAAEIIQVFDSCFVRSHATHLVGGGADLTPYYLFDEDITFFHENEIGK